MIGKIQRVKLREVWKHEALDFTTWLEDNIDVLADALDLTLVNVEREQSAGTFNVDLVAEDDGGNLVIIENQLEKSNHDHLGKIITYLTSLEAKTAIWIVSEPRPEHVKAIAWLNESSSAAFYLVKVEAIKIGESPAAPLLTLITGPSEEARNAGNTKKELSERYTIRKNFWTGLLNYARTQTKLHAHISPGQYGWVSTSGGANGLGLNYVIRQHDGQVELYIDLGKDCGDENTQMFEKLYAHKQKIEDVFGETLEWQPLDGRRACRIRKRIDVGGWADADKWPEIQKAMVDAMVRFEKALRPYVKKL
ncbi:MAG: DUF4268 domain-containing protein [Candidatus Hydrogenedentes bacterium]|nr:DUF4268 domain-containing protein [Candidatus Hydrogenedentota bacterium]